MFDAVPTPIAAGEPPGGSSDRYSPSVADDEHGTTHYSIVDGERNAIAFTTTIEANFGSAFVVDGTGMLLNNELTVRPEPAF